jgi:predicted nucleic acid-binding protein
MRVLVDTNILTRSIEPGHAMYQPARDSVAFLRTRGDQLHVVPQILYEFWVVCTRPASANGLGKTPAETVIELAALKSLFGIIDDVPAILPEWERIVATFQVIGRNAHDARLVAAMRVHGASHILTFNDQDFRRFGGITILTPAALLAPPTTP